MYDSFILEYQLSYVKNNCQDLMRTADEGSLYHVGIHTRLVLPLPRLPGKGTVVLIEMFLFKVHCDVLL